MKKRIALLLLALSSSVHAIDFGLSIEEKKEVEKQKKIILLLLQDHQEGNLSVLPSDVKKHIVGFMMRSEPCLTIKS